MKYDDFRLIYEEMIAVYKRDPELTHIEVTFHIQEVKKCRKTAKIAVSTINKH